MDVEPFPRMKLMKLYYLTIEELKDLPDKYGKIGHLYQYRLQVPVSRTDQVQDEASGRNQVNQGY